MIQRGIRGPVLFSPLTQFQNARNASGVFHPVKELQLFLNFSSIEGKTRGIVHLLYCLNIHKVHTHSHTSSESTRHRRANVSNPHPRTSTVGGRHTTTTRDDRASDARRRSRDDRERARCGTTRGDPASSSASSSSTSSSSSARAQRRGGADVERDVRGDPGGVLRVRAERV